MFRPALKKGYLYFYEKLSLYLLKRRCSSLTISDRLIDEENTSKIKNGRMSFSIVLD